MTTENLINSTEATTKIIAPYKEALAVARSKPMFKTSDRMDLIELEGILAMLADDNCDQISWRIEDSLQEIIR